MRDLRVDCISRRVTEKVTRSERILGAAVNRGLLTENGEAAVIAALDPFHDTRIKHQRGWPDLETAPSVNRCIRQSFTVKSNADGDNIMIYTWPILNKNFTERTARRNAVIDLITPGVSTNFEVGGVTVRHFPDLTDMTLTAGTHAWTSGLDAEYLDDVCRLTGMGVEVTDVTAEIYKQGTLTAFQMPQSTAEPQTFFVRDVAVTLDAPAQNGIQRVLAPAPLAPHPQPTPVQAYPLKKWPSQFSTIMQLEGTRQWGAKDGCYVVVPFHGRDNFAGQPVYDVPAIYVDSAQAQEEVGGLNTAPFNIGQYAEPIIDQDALVFLANKFAPTHSKGILLSGLNANSTFTINVVYFIESFPDPADMSLITLAQPSASLDEVALEMISRGTQSLPIAVPVDENGLGDWFAEVVAEVAPWIGAAAGGLGFAPGALAAEAAATAAKAYMGSKMYTPTKGGARDKRIRDSKLPKKPKSKQPSPNSPAAGARQVQGPNKREENAAKRELKKLEREIAALERRKTTGGKK